MDGSVTSCVLFASLLAFIGCYNTGTITKEEFTPTVEQVDITLYTKDSLEYKFSKESYRIQGDTLSGSGVEMSMSGSDDDGVFATIPLSDITSVEVEEVDATGTKIVYALCVGAFVALLAGAAAPSEF